MEDDALTRRVLACCYAVQRDLGPGYAETTYQAAVTRELERANLPFKRAEWFPVIYRDEEIDRLQVDFTLDNMTLKVMSKSNLDKQDVAIGMACLKTSGMARGLLINFGADPLQVKRLAAVVRAKE